MTEHLAQPEDTVEDRLEQERISSDHLEAATWHANRAKNLMQQAKILFEQAEDQLKKIK